MMSPALRPPRSASRAAFGQIAQRTTVAIAKRIRKHSVRLNHGGNDVLAEIVRAAFGVLIFDQQIE